MIDEIVQKYLEKHPDERSGLKVLLKQLAAGEKLQTRKNFTGHVVGTAVVLSPDKKQVLLIYHPTFAEWQQPGGHWDEDEAGPWLTAEREAVEETGVSLDRRLNDIHQPILIESHVVPAHQGKNEPEHRHHAFWYAFNAKSKDLKLEDEVIKEARWVNIENVAKPEILIVIERLKA